MPSLSQVKLNLRFKPQNPLAYRVLGYRHSELFAEKQLSMENCFNLLFDMLLIIDKSDLG